MRITNKHLDSIVEELNTITGNPVEPYTQLKQGVKANIGNYHVNEANGGVCLHQMMNDGGGVNDVFNNGRQTKRELYNQIKAMVKGYRLAQQ